MLTDGYLPEQIILGSDHDIEIDGKTFIDCVAWDDYCHDTHGVEITYTSRLVSGLLEYKGAYSKNGVTREFGFGVQSKENVAREINRSYAFPMKSFPSVHRLFGTTHT